MGARQPSTGLAGRVREALADGEIARDALAIDLIDLDAVEIDVAGQAVTVTITLPMPADGARGAIERDVTRTVGAIDGVESVDCRFDPAVPDAGERVEFLPEVKHVVAVASGKGGVGKSTVAVNLATALAAAGADVGLLDADVYGPNAPTMLGLEDSSPDATPEDEIVPRHAHGVAVMSMEFIVDADDPVIWRGPMVDAFITQLFDDVDWGSLDYLIVDLPPGTGDAQLSVVQNLPVTGAVIVTTPELVATDDAQRGLRGFAKYNVPILGIAENMSHFECPDCGSGHDIFGSDGGARLAAAFDVPVLGQLPLDPDIGTLERDAEVEQPPGVSIPGLGRLQLPRLQAERERPTSCPPIAVREDGGSLRTAFELLATRVAARINRLAVERETAESEDTN